MNRVINFCVALSGLIYLTFSMVAYANFGQVVQPNVLRNYPIKNVEMIIARALFALLAIFSYPLQTLPCRNSLENLLPLSRNKKKSHSTPIHISLTSFILAGTFLCAFLLDNLSLVSSIIGTIAGIPICYILPFAFYYKLTEGRGFTWKRIAAGCLAIFGLLAMIVNTVSIVMSIVNPSSK